MIFRDQTNDKQVAMIVMVAIAIGFMSPIVTTPLAEAQIVAPQGSPPGAPGSQLAALTDMWFQRILSIDTSNPLTPNPFTKTYTGDCSQLIQGNTIFLVGQGPAGSLSDHGTCFISPQTNILFPLVNGFDIDCTSQQQQSKPPGLCTFNMQTPARGQPFEQLRNNPFVAEVSDATNLAASLDRVPLQPTQVQQVQSPPGGFEVRLAPNNVFGFPFGPVTLHGVSNGFWVLLPPLSPGQHFLSFGGCLPPDIGGCQTNTYTLVVQ